MASRLKKPSSCPDALLIWSSNQITHVKKSVRAAVLVGALCAAAACGFQPVHQNSGGDALLTNISVSHGDDDQLMRRALARIIGVGESAVWSASFRLDEKSSESQLDEQGIAQRLRIDMVLQLRLTNQQNGAQRAARFVETQYISGNSDSGAGDMIRRQSLRQLAVQGLANKATRFIRNATSPRAAQETEKETPLNDLSVEPIR